MTIRLVKDLHIIDKSLDLCYMKLAEHKTELLMQGDDAPESTVSDVFPGCFLCNATPPFKSMYIHFTLPTNISYTAQPLKMQSKPTVS